MAYLKFSYRPKKIWKFTTNLIISALCLLTHWGRVTHICIGKLTIIGSDNGLSPRRRHAIIWTNAGILLIGPSGTNFSEIIIEIHTFAFKFKKMHLKQSYGKRRHLSRPQQHSRPQSYYWPFVRGIHQLLVYSSHKWPVMRKAFYIMTS